jgi:hypothetical protein
MTEAKWWGCDDPAAMLQSLTNQASDRKLRLFAAACCRHIWHLLPDQTNRQLVALSERVADGLKTVSSLEGPRMAATETAGRLLRAAAWSAVLTANDNARVAAFQTASAAAWAAVPEKDKAAGRTAYSVPLTEQFREQAELLRDLFGDPFRPSPAIDPAWLVWNDATVIKLAQSIYDDRRFEDLPILADALEEAGCTDAGLLAHCRGPGPHVRGCWAVDLILAKDR